MDKRALRQLTEAVYTDAAGTIYIYMKEFLARHQMPDTPEVRQAVLAHVRQEFGEVKIVVADNAAEED